MNFWVAATPLLLGLPVAGLWAWLSDPSGRVRLGAREAAIWAGVCWAAFAALSTELLSLGAGHNLNLTSGHLSRGWLVLVWAIPAVAGVVLLWISRGAVANQMRRLRELAHAPGNLDRYLAAAILFCAGLVALVALVSAPTTWDSMVYHLARVAAWLQLGGVNHYATHAEPQLFQPPGAEYLIAQLQALSGGDRFAAGVQTCAYALSILAASLAARELGCNRRGQLLAGFLVATLPMAIMQGSSTQNDLLVSLWLIVAAALALRLESDERLAIPRALVACVAVGLAILTKGTAWIYLPPILLMLAWAIHRRVGTRGLLAFAVAGLAIVLALNAGQWERNHETFGKYVYSGAGPYDYSNDAHRPKDVFSNLVRNSAIYFGTPSESINNTPTRLFTDALTALGIDSNSRATTFPGDNFVIGRSGPDESHGPSILIFVLICWSLIATFALAALRTRRRVTWALMLIAQMLLFSLLIKWQTWHSRLHLPVTVLAAPLIAATLSLVPRSEAHRKLLTIAVVSIASLLAPIYLAFNVDRPLISYGDHRSILTTPRDQQYFAARPDLARPYLTATRYLNERGIERLAFYGNIEDWYYPFNALMDDDARTSYVFVSNPSKRYPQPDPKKLEAVACLICDRTRQAVLRSIGMRPVPGLYNGTPPVPAPLELWVRR